MLSSGKKAILLVALAATLAAVGVFAYTSRQAAEARENPSTHASRVNRAVQEAEDMIYRQ